MTNLDGVSAEQLHHGELLVPPTLIRPSAEVPTVSVAAVFKRKKLDRPHNKKNSSASDKSKSNLNRQKQKDGVHPLALAFKETNLDILLERLYKGNLQAVPSDLAPDASQTSPVELSAIGKPQRAIREICQPFSRYRYSVHNHSGETLGRIDTTLHNRFQSFQEQVQAETEQIKVLQRQWEGVVAEIFQLGIACLGESDMIALLSTADTGSNAAKPASRAASTISGGDQESPSVRAGKKRKHLSSIVPAITMMFPDFLFHRSTQQKHIQATPSLPVKEIRRFKKEVSSLGSQHVDKFQTIEEGHKAWWKKKQKHLVQFFMDG
ncbi:hypothetical protein E8E13_011657 [Curvularia kusanoi]|uniref:Uncharacterized protein n=1 Tax=Curvularia kusanoi TaxID=90978 RepID=A0A9P5BTR1_CURKU|nr:hypothetical protein E8E13_011657 [Curvularia kusanoi]